MQIQLLNIIGSLAAICTTVTFIPQVIKVAKTKETQGISLCMYLIYIASVILWFTYGILIRSYEIIFTNIIVFPMTIYILYYIIINNNNS